MEQPLILRRVKLTDFLSHRDTEIEFIQGVNVLIGPNGAGKSSILEAIYFAFKGRGWRTGKEVRGLINENATSAQVVLEFLYGGDTYKIVRRINAPGTAIYRNNELIAYGGEIDKAIREILGIPLTQLDKIIIIPQGSITKLFTEVKPSDRKDAIDKLLGLNTYADAGEKLKDIPVKPGKKLKILGITHVYPKKDLDRVINDYRQRIMEKYREFINERRKYLEEIRRNRERRRMIEEKIRELEVKASRLEEIESMLNEIRGRVSEINGRIKTLEDNRERYRRELDRLTGEKKRVESEIRELEGKTRILEYRGLVERLKELLEEREKVEGILNALKPRYMELKALRDELEKLMDQMGSSPEEIRREYEEVMNKLSSLREELNKLTAEYSEAKTRLAEAERYEGEYMDRVNRLIGLLRGLGVEANVDNLAVKLGEALKLLREEKKELETERERLLEEESRYKTLIEDTRHKLSLIEKSREARCPLCGQPLTSEHRSRIISKLRRDIEEYEEKLERIRRRLRENTEKLEAVNNTLTKLPENIVDEARELVGRIRDIRGIIAETRKRIGELEDRIRDIRNAIREADERERSLRSLIELASRYTALSSRLDQRELSVLEKQLDQYSSKLRVIIEEINGIRDRVIGVFGIKEMDREEINKLLEELRIIEGMKNRLDELRLRRELIDKQVNDLRSELEKIEGELEVLRGEVEKLGRAIKDVEDQYNEAREARDKIQEYRAEITVIDKLLGEYEEKLEEINSRIRDLRDDVEVVNDVFRKALILRWIRERLFHRDGVPRHLRRRIIRVMEGYMERLMEKFNLGFQDVEIDENYNISFSTIDNPGVKRSMNKLSGGEQTSMSMAALLSLFYIVSGRRIGFMALDEPTAHLDEERQRKLVEVLKEFQGGRILPQLIVVTHDESVKEAGDKIYFVEKIDGVSRVRELRVE